MKLIERFNSRVNDYLGYRDVSKSGRLNYIPFKYHFPRLSEYLRGIIRGTYYLITAGSGVGKSKLARYIFITIPSQYAEVNKHIKLKIIYFAIEESAEEILDYLISQQLWLKYRIRIAPERLSLWDNLEDDVIEKIKSCYKFFEDLDLDIVDNISNPFGMYKYCRDVSNQLGTHHFTEENGVKVYKGYEFHNKDTYAIAIFDHYALVSPEKGQNLHQAIGHLSSEYMRKQMTKHWGWICVGIQQQESAGENVEHYKAGRLEPTLSKLGNNKETQRDALVVLGLYAPDRYSLDMHNNYPLSILRDTYRSMHILKNRKGSPNKTVPLFFDGMVEVFEEMPLHEDKERLNQYYKKAKTLYNNPNTKTL